MTLVKGSIVYAKATTYSCRPGARGVCHNVSEINGKPSYGVIFENGIYDSFSPFEAEQFLSETGRICPSVLSYQFKDAASLSADFDAGRFAPAFSPDKRPALRIVQP